MNTPLPSAIKTWQSYCVETGKTIDYLPYQGDSLEPYEVWLKAHYKTQVTITKKLKAIQEIALLPGYKVIPMLAAQYPKVFNFNKPLPLAIGIDKIIEIPNVHGRSIKAALRIWCRKPTYLKNLSRKKHRYNLDGSIASANELYVPPKPKPKPKPNLINNMTTKPIIPTPCRCEITLKFNEAPELTTNGELLLVQDSMQYKAIINAKKFRKTIESAKAFPMWIGALKGKISAIENGVIILKECSVQVFEKKPKESAPETA